MKLTVIFKNPIKKSEMLFPRDVRNLLAALTKNDKELNSIILHHERKQSPILFPMPSRRSFSICTYRDDLKGTFEKLKEIIEKNGIKISGDTIEIKEVFISPYYYSDFREGIFEREFYTPMVIAKSSREYAIAREATNDKNNIDMPALKKLIINTIHETLRFQHRDWFGKEDFELDDLIIVLKDIKYLPIRYKENEWYPAIKGTVVSNRLLPDFLGYKSGMGYGELCSISETKRRSKIARKNT